MQSYKTDLKLANARFEDQRKKLSKVSSEHGKEKQAFESKEKQYLAEIRKKDGTIKNLQDRMQESQFRMGKKPQATPINSMEVTGEILRNGPSCYTNATSDFLEMINNTDSSSFEKLKTENRDMRAALFDLQSMMTEIVNIRKAVMERSLGGIDYEDSHFLTELKQELFRVSSQSMSTNTLVELRENMKRFRAFMDKIDSYKFRSSIDSNFKSQDDQDIDEIKNIKRLKDLLSKSGPSPQKTTGTWWRTRTSCCRRPSTAQRRSRLCLTSRRGTACWTRAGWRRPRSS